MAQLVPVIGAVAGFLGTYGPAILSVVSVAASIALQFTARGGIDAEGPRLQDTGVTTSTYGNGIPTVIGRGRLAGNMIWATEIDELKVQKKAGGKGSMFGGGSPTQTTYEYFGNFAMAFGKGDGAGCIAQIFMDKKLVYDATGGSAAFFKYKNAAIRIYMGGASQEPDPLIEADKGAGNVPAHRDLVYVVFENLPLIDFGNRIPQVEAVVDSSAAATSSKTSTTGTDLPTMVFEDSRYLRTTRQLYLVDGTRGIPGGNSWILRVDMVNNAQGAFIESTVPGPPYLFDTEFGDAYGINLSGVFPYEDGKVFVQGNTTDGDGIVRINPFTLDAMTVTKYSVNPPDSNGNFQEEASISFTRAHPTGVKNYTLLAHNWFSGAPDIEAKIYIWDRDEEILSGPQIHLGEAGATGFTLQASCADRDGIVWLIGEDQSVAADGAGRKAHLVRIQIDRTLNAPLLGLGESAEPKVEVIDIAPAGLNNPKCIAYDSSSHSLVIAGSDLDSNNEFRWVRWDIATRAVVASRTFDTDTAGDDNFRLSSFNAQSWQMNGVQNGELIAVSISGATDPKVYRIRTIDLTSEELAEPTSIPLQARIVWDPANNQAWFMPATGSAGNFELLKYDRCIETPVPLEDVITELVELTRELGASDIDVTDAGILAQDLRGFILGRQIEVRRAIETLIFPFQLDIVESDGKLKFLTRGSASARTITEDDLGSQVRSKGNPEKLQIDRSQEAEVPFRIDLRYIDWDRDFLEGNQSAQRHQAPFKTQFSPEIAQITAPVALNAQEAQRAVEAGLFSAWVGRTGYRLGLGTKHLDLDPTDVITVQRDGEDFVMRLTEWQLGDGFSTSLIGASEDVESYDSTAAGGAAGVAAPTFGPPGATELFVLDIPLLRDVDDPNQLGTGVYVGFGRYQDNWRTGVADRSLNGGARWDRFSVSRGSAPWGFLTAAVSALSLEADNTYPSEINRLDETTNITVQIVADEDELSSITREELWTLTDNAMVIGNGEAAEIVRFQNVTDNGDGTFTFDTLLRGRRGTEEAALAGHSTGERVIFLSEEDINREGIDLTRITLTDFYRATSVGEVVESSAIQSLTLQGNDLRPYPVARPEASPAHTGAARGAVTVTWTRRSRIGGNYDLTDGVRQSEVPVGEQSEAYECVLLDKVSGDEAVSKTATDDATGVTFDLTDIVTTAGYTDGDLLDVVIYQTSAVVGRGLPRTVSL